MASTPKKQDPLTGLFGNQLRPRLLRVFMHGTKEAYNPDDMRKALGVTSSVLKKELTSLLKAGILRKKEILIDNPRGKKKKRVGGYALDKRYPHLDLVNALFINTFPAGGRDLSDNIQKTGNVKTILASGLFVGDAESTADLLIVGSNIKDTKLRNILTELEKTLGSEVRYMTFEPNDFLHRISINDRLIRGVTDHNYRVLIDKLRVIKK